LTQKISRHLSQVKTTSRSEHLLIKFSPQSTLTAVANGNLRSWSLCSYSSAVIKTYQLGNQDQVMNSYLKVLSRFSAKLMPIWMALLHNKSFWISASRIAAKQGSSNLRHLKKTNRSIQQISRLWPAPLKSGTFKDWLTRSSVPWISIKMESWASRKWGNCFFKCPNTGHKLMDETIHKIKFKVWQNVSSQKWIWTATALSISKNLLTTA
jgi:hypothetical protein